MRASTLGEALAAQGSAPEDAVVQWHEAMLEAVDVLAAAGRQSASEALGWTGAQEHAHWSWRAGDVAREKWGQKAQTYALAQESSAAKAPDWERMIAGLWAWREGLEQFLRSERRRAEAGRVTAQTASKAGGESARCGPARIGRSGSMDELHYEVRVHTRHPPEGRAAREAMRAKMVRALHKADIGPAGARVDEWSAERLVVVWERESTDAHGKEGERAPGGSDADANDGDDVRARALDEEGEASAGTDGA